MIALPAIKNGSRKMALKEKMPQICALVSHTPEKQKQNK